MFIILTTIKYLQTLFTRSLPKYINFSLFIILSLYIIVRSSVDVYNRVRNLRLRT